MREIGNGNPSSQLRKASPQSR